MIKSISLEDISFTRDKEADNTAWEKLGVIANAKRANNNHAVKMVNPVYLKHNVLQFAY